MSTPIAERGYSQPDVLVSTDWVAEHKDDPSVRLLESNEDVLLYDLGHIPGALKIDWHDDLNDRLRRDYVSKQDFETLKLFKDTPESRKTVKELFNDVGKALNADAKKIINEVIDSIKNFDYENAIAEVFAKIGDAIDSPVGTAVIAGAAVLGSVVFGTVSYMVLFSSDNKKSTGSKILNFAILRAAKRECQALFRATMERNKHREEINEHKKAARELRKIINDQGVTRQDKPYTAEDIPQIAKTLDIDLGTPGDKMKAKYKELLGEDYDQDRDPFVKEWNDQTTKLMTDIESGLNVMQKASLNPNSIAGRQIINKIQILKEQVEIVVEKKKKYFTNMESFSESRLKTKQELKQMQQQQIDALNQQIAELEKAKG